MLGIYILSAMLGGAVRLQLRISQIANRCSMFASLSNDLPVRANAPTGEGKVQPTERIH